MFSQILINHIPKIALTIKELKDIFQLQCKIINQIPNYFYYRPSLIHHLVYLNQFKTLLSTLKI